MSVSSVTIGGKIKYKLVLLGNQHVGKSSIIDRFINDRFEQTYNATIGIDFLVRNIVHQSKTYRLQLWDTAGQQRFKALIPSYLKDSNCALIVYDINCPQSLKSVRRWIQFYNDHKQQMAFGVLVGNKSDLSARKDSCTQEEMEKMINQVGIPSFKISAKTGEGVQELFISIIEHILESQNKEKNLGSTESKKENKDVIEEETGVKIKIENNIKLDEQIQKQTVVQKGCC